MQGGGSDQAMVLSGGKTCGNLFFLDLETTGLDFTTNKILEVGVVVTDKNLNFLDSYWAVIHYASEELCELSEWTKKEFTGNLLDQVAHSTKSMDDVKREFADFLDRYRDKKKVIIAGSSATFDRLCLQYAMPDVVETRLHYRVVDVSSVMECIKRWNPQVFYESPHRPVKHRALDDAMESLNCLRFYKQYAFRTPDETKAVSPELFRKHHHNQNQNQGKPYSHQPFGSHFLHGGGHGQGVHQMHSPHWFAPAPHAFSNTLQTSFQPQ